MAATLEGRRLTGRERRRQAAIVAATVADTQVLMDLLDPTDLDRTSARWVRATEAMIREHRADSERAAAAYLRAFRGAEIGDPDVEFRRQELSARQVRQSLLLTGPARIRDASARGVPLREAVNAATASASGAASRHAVNGSRDGTFETLQQDRRAQGFQRYTSGDPCAFCAMLASRGAIYKSADAALGGRFATGMDDRKVHDHCQCALEPIYDAEGNQVPERSQQFEELWNQAQREAGEAGELLRGTSNDALNAFRRLYEAA